MTASVATVRDALYALARAFDRGLEALEETTEDTVFILVEDPSGAEQLTVVLHADGSYGLSFPPPSYSAEEMDASDDEEEPDEEEEYPDAGR